MKKLIAALIGVPIALASVGDDVVRFFANQADDAARVASGFANQADDAARVASGFANQADDAARVASGFANQADEVASVAPGVVNLNQAKRVAKQVVYDDVHKAILSGVNQSSINDLMAVANAANNKQYQQTGVYLSNAALLTLVYQAGAANAATNSQ